jgi:hypothetical protein
MELVDYSVEKSRHAESRGGLVDAVEIKKGGISWQGPIAEPIKDIRDGLDVECGMGKVNAAVLEIYLYAKVKHFPKDLDNVLTLILQLESCLENRRVLRK